MGVTFFCLGVVGSDIFWDGVAACDISLGGYEWV